MAFSEYRVPSFNMYALPQDTQVTCWAACAASARACKERRAYTEETALPEAFRAWYTQPRPLRFDDISNVYRAMGMQAGRIDLSSRPALAQFIRAHAPIIVGSAILTPQGAHVSYHVRLINGFWGDPDAGNEDAFQVRIYDPWPPSGFAFETNFLFSHFRYQMTMRSGRVPENIGRIWYF